MGGSHGLTTRASTEPRRKRKRPRCCGCSKQMSLKPTETRPICARCRRDPKKLHKAIVEWERRKERAMIVREADEATKNLKPGVAFNPLVGEKMILKMMRGDW
jgi:hypothetical protein